MNDWRERWQKALADLERERDELRVRIHLAKAEGRDELARLEAKIEELRFRAGAASTEAREVAEDVGGALRNLVNEIRTGLDRVRKTF